MSRRSRAPILDRADPSGNLLDVPVRPTVPQGAYQVAEGLAHEEASATREGIGRPNSGVLDQSDDLDRRRRAERWSMP